MSTLCHFTSRPHRLRPLFRSAKVVSFRLPSFGLYHSTPGHGRRFSPRRDSCCWLLPYRIVADRSLVHASIRCSRSSTQSPSMPLSLRGTTTCPSRSLLNFDSQFSVSLKLCLVASQFVCGQALLPVLVFSSELRRQSLNNAGC